MQNKQDFMKTKPVFPLLLSMAAPMVTGTAAMLYSCDASLSLMDVRNRILQSARPLESLSGKVATGGMLDAGAAMP